MTIDYLDLGVLHLNGCRPTTLEDLEIVTVVIGTVLAIEIVIEMIAAKIDIEMTSGTIAEVEIQTATENGIEIGAETEIDGLREDGGGMMTEKVVTGIEISDKRIEVLIDLEMQNHRLPKIPRHRIGNLT